MDLLSIVIVNWNSSDFAVDCIASLHATTTDVPFEVIVVDNASTENVSRIVDVHPGVRLLASHQNLGFARANNLGVEQSQGRWILFLNPDTIVLKNAIRVMLSNLESHAEVGAVGCRLLNGDMTLQMSSVQRFPTILNQLLSLDVLKRRWPKARLWGTSALFTDSPVAVDVVSGACLMVKREVFEQAGRFSPDYFLYAEEVDLCYKINNLGYQIHHVGEAKVIHFGGQSTKQRDSSFSNTLMRESVFSFLRRTRGAVYAHLYRLALLTSSVARMLFLIASYPLLTLAGHQARKRDAIRALQKWFRIAKWSVGLQQWTWRLGVDQ